MTLMKRHANVCLEKSYAQIRWLQRRIGRRLDKILSLGRATISGGAKNDSLEKRVAPPRASLLPSRNDNVRRSLLPGVHAKPLDCSKTRCAHSWFVPQLLDAGRFVVSGQPSKDRRLPHCAVRVAPLVTRVRAKRRQPSGTRFRLRPAPQ
jgi:hypothetical protein